MDIELLRGHVKTCLFRFLHVPFFSQEPHTYIHKPNTKLMSTALYLNGKGGESMSAANAISDSFAHHIRKATDKIRKQELEEAHDLIVEAIVLNPDSPQPQNLLGLWHELKGNADMARRHFRAAYSLDPTYKPACANLERISALFGCRNMPVDYGPEMEPDGKTEPSRPGSAG